MKFKHARIDGRQVRRGSGIQMAKNNKDQRRVNPFKPLRQQFEGASGKSANLVRQFGPFSRVVKSYGFKKSGISQIDPEQLFNLNRLDELLRYVCPGGQPISEINGRRLDWRHGLVALCNPEVGTFVGSSALGHQKALFDLHAAWRKLEDTDLGHPMYVDRIRSGSARRRGAYLAPGLPISHRERLSDHYINAVLRPFERAVIECRQLFWKQLKAGHSEGLWIGLRQTEHGTFAPIMPGSGFGAGRNYEIDRTTYLEGFALSEDEIDKGTYPQSQPYIGQEQWLFLGADQVPEFQHGNVSTAFKGHGVARQEAGVSTKLGRPPGTGFQKVDAPFVEKAVNLIQDDPRYNATSATRYVIEEFAADIPGASFEAKETRIRKQVIQKLSKQE